MGVSLGRGGSGNFSSGNGGNEVYFRFQRFKASEWDSRIIGDILCQVFQKSEADIKDIDENVLLGNEAIVFHASSTKRAWELANCANAIIARNKPSKITADHMTFGVR